MHRALAIAAVLVALVIALTASADQDDPRLDRLFEQLVAADSAPEIERLTRRIWVIWRAHEDQTVRQEMRRAAAAMSADRLAAAESHLDRVVDRAPGYAEGWNQRATVRYLRGRFAESAADISRVLALEPRHFGALEGLGLIYLEKDLPRAALDAFERALAVNPHLPGARERVRRLRRGQDRDGGT